MRPEPLYADELLIKQPIFKHPVTELGELFEQLTVEHEQLKKQLQTLYIRARAVGANHRVHNWHAALTSLRKEVDRFLKSLDEHSEWEEEIIFPLVCLHSGKSISIFYVIEQEHEIAKQYIEDFLAEMDIVQDHIGSVQAHELAACLLQALYILNEHFRKEEELIIPFTEKMLVDMEQFFSL